MSVETKTQIDDILKSWNEVLCQSETYGKIEIEQLAKGASLYLIVPAESEIARLVAGVGLNIPKYELNVDDFKQHWFAIRGYRPRQKTDHLRQPIILEGRTSEINLEEAKNFIEKIVLKDQSWTIRIQTSNQLSLIHLSYHPQAEINWLEFIGSVLIFWPGIIEAKRPYGPSLGCPDRVFMANKQFMKLIKSGRFLNCNYIPDINRMCINDADDYLWGLIYLNVLKKLFHLIR